MATASPSDLVLELAAARSPTLGEGRLVCVDGPAGSGKTTLGTELAQRTGAQLIHTDDLMSGWRDLAGVRRQLQPLCEELAAGRAATYEHYDWLAGRYTHFVPVPSAPWLVVEGVGSGAATIAAYTTVLVWVEVDEELRLARGLARDGAELEEHWRQFMLDEQRLFARDRACERADVVVDGTGRTSPVVR